MRIPETSVTSSKLSAFTANAISLATVSPLIFSACPSFVAPIQAMTGTIPVAVNASRSVGINVRYFSYKAICFFV